MNRTGLESKTSKQTNQRINRRDRWNPLCLYPLPPPTKSGVIVHSTIKRKRTTNYLFDTPTGLCLPPTYTPHPHNLHRRLLRPETSLLSLSSLSPSLRLSVLILILHPPSSIPSFTICGYPSQLAPSLRSLKSQLCRSKSNPAGRTRSPRPHTTSLTRYLAGPAYPASSPIAFASPHSKKHQSRCLRPLIVPIVRQCDHSVLRPAAVIRLVRYMTIPVDCFLCCPLCCLITFLPCCCCS